MPTEAWCWGLVTDPTFNLRIQAGSPTQEQKVYKVNPLSIIWFLSCSVLSTSERTQTCPLCLSLQLCHAVLGDEYKHLDMHSHAGIANTFDTFFRGFLMALFLGSSCPPMLDVVKVTLNF